MGGRGVYKRGAHGSGLGDVWEWIRIGNGTGTARKVQAEELDLVYRGSSFTKGQYDNRVVLEAEFTLWRGDEAELMERVRDLDRRRLAAQPRGRNAGSIFKTTPEHPAERVQDQVGLRGQ